MVLVKQGRRDTIWGDAESTLGLETRFGVTLDTLRTMDCDLSWEKG